jgi:hypothetical protein
MVVQGARDAGHSNASPMTRVVSGSKLISPRNGVMGINVARCRQERDRASTIGLPESLPVVMAS